MDDCLSGWLEVFSTPAGSPQAGSRGFVAVYDRSSLYLESWMSLPVMGGPSSVPKQTGNSPKRWDKTGIVIEVKHHDQYVVKIDSSGRLTTQNCRFLRNFEPTSIEIQCAPPSYQPFQQDSLVTPNVLYTPTQTNQVSSFMLATLCRTFLRRIHKTVRRIVSMKPNLAIESYPGIKAAIAS
ncbi:transcription factor iiib 90 kda subunit [Plakobranchus ocellatus]|uniref:Transcription factor iiib 90 kDa subunit n=1 Tax=Plakobranchus ocellatus TaxID=259542 RepID=A0AAV4D8B3_9GAST|nr:transcription factor iiib 90 kda subunit [Plakobranchus ocellatus]